MATGSNDITLRVDDAVIEPSDIENDLDLQLIAAKFANDVIITPDTDLNVDPSEVVPNDSDSSNSSSLRDNDEFYDSSDEIVKPKSSSKNGDAKPAKSEKSSLNGTVEYSSKIKKPETKSSKTNKSGAEKSKDVTDTQSVKSKQGCSPVKSKNPLKMLKKLTKFDKSSKKPDFRSEFSVVTIDRLPQIFVVKYLGHRDVKGVTGLHHVRKPVDEMVQQMKTKIDGKEELNLPLLYVIVSAKGMDLREHQTNKVKGKAPMGVIPLDFISYGVQDIKYWRIFTCIIVRALSWQSKQATCHAFLCDSSHSGRKMALSLGAAFEVKSKKLKTEGKTHNFQVELRPPDELAEELHEFDA